MRKESLFAMTARNWSGLKSGLLIFLIMACNTTVYANNAALSAEFDWSMPSRLFDANKDGIPEYDPLMAVEPADGWQINLDACLSHGNLAITEYSWQLDGVTVTSTAACDAAVISVDSLGFHTVKLTIKDSDGALATSEKEIEIKNILLVGLGDSFASGEGNPDVPAVIPDVDNVMADIAGNIAESEVIKQNIADFYAYLASWQQVRNTAQTTYDNTLKYSSAIAYNGPLYVTWWLLVEPACLQAFGIYLTPNDCTTAKNNRDYYYNKTLAAINGLGISYINMYNDMYAIRTAAENAVSNALATLNEAQSQVDYYAGLIVDEENNLDLNKTALADILASLGAYPGQWLDEECHRSAISGQAQAALRLEQADEKSNVTFVHLACSGATITNGLTDTQARANGGVPSQVEQLAARIGARTIDTLLVSIGGNDVGFSTILKSCVESEPCLTLCPDGITLCDGSGLDVFNAGLNTIKADLDSNGSFASLQAKLTAVLGAKLDASNAYFTSYPDMLQDDDGTACQKDPNDFWSTMPGFSDSEMAAARVLTTQLNTEVGTLVASNGWNFINTLPDAMASHGYCADDHWIVRMNETLIMQGDKSGMVHPNLKGHQAYANEISNTIIPVLIPERSETAVTTYQEAPETGALHPFSLLLLSLVGLARLRRTCA